MPSKRNPVKRLRAALLALALLPVCASPWPAADDLEKKIDALIRRSGAETVAVAWYDLQTGAELMINADEPFHAASTMKVPVMMEVFRQAREGRLALDDRLTVKNDFASIADGSRYSVSSESDSELTLYRKIGRAETVAELTRLMIVASSNLATNILIERVTAARVMDLMKAMGAANMRVLRGVEDGKAYESGLNNSTTARDLLILLRAIAERRAVSERDSDAMLRILLGQRFNEGIPAGLPANVRVAHKTGSITRIYHDAAIVLPPNRKPYVLVVLTRGFDDEIRAHRLVAEISHAVYRQ